VNKVEMTSSVIKFIQNVVKIGQMIQKLKETWTQAYEYLM